MVKTQEILKMNTIALQQHQATDNWAQVSRTPIVVERETKKQFPNEHKCPV